MRRAQDGVAHNNAGHCGRCILAGECRAGRGARASVTSRIRFPRRFARPFVVRGGQHVRSVNIPRLEGKKKESGAAQRSAAAVALSQIGTVLAAIRLSSRHVTAFHLSTFLYSPPHLGSKRRQTRAQCIPGMLWVQNNISSSSPQDAISHSSNGLQMLFFSESRPLVG